MNGISQLPLRAIVDVDEGRDFVRVGVRKRGRPKGSMEPQPLSFLSFLSFLTERERKGGLDCWDSVKVQCGSAEKKGRGLSAELSLVPPSLPYHRNPHPPPLQWNSGRPSTPLLIASTLRLLFIHRIHRLH